MKKEEKDSLKGLKKLEKRQEMEKILVFKEGVSEAPTETKRAEKWPAKSPIWIPFLKSDFGF